MVLERELRDRVAQPVAADERGAIRHVLHEAARDLFDRPPVLARLALLILNEVFGRERLAHVVVQRANACDEGIRANPSRRDVAQDGQVRRVQKRARRLGDEPAEQRVVVAQRLDERERRHVAEHALDDAG